MRFSILLLLTLALGACISPKPVALFDAPANQKTPKGIKNFFATQIFEDYITNDIWFSKEGTCLSVSTNKDVKYSGEASLHLKWDKVSQGCPFIGLGFGWDAWNGKNMASIINEAAIEMWFKMEEGQKTSLPLAACLEDYSGRQAWLGFSDNTVVGNAVTTEWTKIRLPLSEFDWTEFGCDASNIKQLIIQFEADGDVYLDDIKVVPYTGSFRKRALVLAENRKCEDTEDCLHSITVDGDLSDWDLPSTQINGQNVYLKFEMGMLFIGGEIFDQTPMMNKNNGDDIWNGDAFEIAFGTKPRDSKKRPYYKSTDRHIGIRLTEQPLVWDWTKHQALACNSVAIKKHSNGIYFEAAISASCLDDFNPKTNVIYGLEMAINKGNEKGRQEQQRWNSGGQEGFNTNPSLWGEVIFINPVN
ncbi:MAG: hypothetical protein KDC92_05755 [Bacteroidetes bacterium]|nr:hypothetical protein [Bacteroidota bacterium]